MTEIRIATLTIMADENGQFVPSVSGAPVAYYLSNRWVKFIGRDAVGWLSARVGTTGYYLLFGPGANGVSPITKTDLRNDPIIRDIVPPDAPIGVTIAGHVYDQDWMLS